MGEKKFCWNCGEPLGESGKFCPKCGAAINREETEPKQTNLQKENKVNVTAQNSNKKEAVIVSGAAPKQKMKKIVLLTGLIGALIIIAIVVMKFGGSTNEQTELSEYIWGKDPINSFIKDNKYKETLDNYYESPDGQVAIQLYEDGSPKSAFISGGDTTIYGIGIGDTFSAESTGRKLTSNGFAYQAENENSVTYISELPDGYKEVQLFIDLENEKIDSIAFSVYSEQSVASGKINQAEKVEPSYAQPNNPESYTSESIDEPTSIQEGTYVYDDGRSVICTAKISASEDGWYIQVKAMGYGGHGQGSVSGKLIDMGQATYSCYDESDLGTFIVRVYKDKINLTMHASDTLSGGYLEEMFNELGGDYILSGEEVSVENSTELDKTKWEERYTDTLEAVQRSYTGLQSDEEYAQKTKEGYEQWDVLLNELYQYLKSVYTEEEFDKIKFEQRGWLVERDSYAEAAKKEANGDYVADAYYYAMTEKTKERILDLINSYVLE